MRPRTINGCIYVEATGGGRAGGGGDGVARCQGQEGPGLPGRKGRAGAGRGPPGHLLLLLPATSTACLLLPACYTLPMTE